MAARQETETQETKPRVAEGLPEEFVAGGLEGDAASLAAARGDGGRRVEDNEGFERHDGDPEDVEAANGDAGGIGTAVDLEVVAPAEESSSENEEDKSDHSLFCRVKKKMRRDTFFCFVLTRLFFSNEAETGLSVLHKNCS